jgi:hypothetical protein
MRLDNSRLSLDIKVQDRYRKWFASLGTAAELEGSCVILGDSDVDYELAPNLNNTRILNSQYNAEGVKYKLLYNGVGKNLAGSIKCFVRRVNADGSMQSLYNYPVTEVFTSGQNPPILANGKNWDRVTFEDAKMGFIFFFQTVLDYYLTDDNIKQRLIEKYTIEIDWDGVEDVAPSEDWDFVKDNDNGSLLIAKKDTTPSPIGLNYRGVITITGQTSKKTKKVEFNF